MCLQFVKCLLKCQNIRLNVRSFAKGIEKMKYLNVAEKNDAAKTIAGLLSNGSARRREGYSVYNKIYDFETPVKGKPSKMIMTSVSGHLLSLEFPSSYRTWRQIDPETLFDAPVIKSCKDDFQPIKRTLEREIRGCQGLIIWTDCDREGENIGFEIIDVCQRINPRITVQRAVFSEITSAAVRRALQHLVSPDKRQSDAVNVRTELDLRSGAVITRYQTMRLQRIFPQSIADKLISYGSCQIPTLGFVVERYKEVEAFVEEPFWKVKVIHTIDDLSVEFNWARNRLFDKSACEDYLLVCLSDPKATVLRVTVKPKHKWRPQPMDTVEMEKLGSRKLKLSAKETMTIAEKLYTKGIISYPRTETNQFSKEFNLSPLVEQQTGHPNWGDFAKRVLEWKPNPRNGNKSDQAHPPIHPTKLVTDLSGNEGRLYELICRHFLACVSKDAVGSETIVEIDIAQEKFTANGLCIYERNYLDVYIYEKWNAKQIHRYEEGQVFDPTSITMHEGSTTAPPLLTEADLIGLMEKNGIGTDATHAEHINTIKERGYIGVIDGGFLVPGVIGMGLYEGYDAMELALSKPHLRASFEEDLKLICAGTKNPTAVLEEQIQKYKDAYKQILNKIQSLDEKIGLRLNETPSNSSSNNSDVSNNQEIVNSYVQNLLPCSKCGVAPMSLKQTKNKNSYFIGCMNFPDCKNVVWLPEECSTPSVLQESCPQCGETYKLLKIKLTTSYYKTLFNAPSGWYKTCLHCDRKFRDAFNINLDVIKRSGGITGLATSIYPISNQANKTVHTSNTNSAVRNVNQANAKSGTINTQRGRKTSKKPSTTTQNTIRSYCTTNDYFDSNDSFNEVIQAAESNLNLNQHVDENLNAASALADCDDELFANLNWATNIRESATNIRQPRDVINSNISSVNNDSENWNWGTNTRRQAQAHQWQSRDIDDNSNDDIFANMSWGTNTRQLANVQQPRNCSISNNMHLATHDSESVTWGNSKKLRLQDTQHNTNKNVTVRCNVCHEEAKRRTVKKVGPNTGRDFFACPKTCNFFQWADDVSQTGSNTTIAPQTSLNADRPTSSQNTVRNNDGNVQRSRQSRKCGLCRQEGHTKLKCPRKAEFEY